MQEPAGDADAHRHGDHGSDAYSARCAVYAAPALSNRDANTISHRNGHGDPDTAPYGYADTTPYVNSYATPTSSGNANTTSSHYTGARIRVGVLRRSPQQAYCAYRELPRWV